MTDQQAPLRIIVADDQASVREGLVLLLDLLPDIEVVAAAADGQEAIDLCGRHRPDAILLDLHMPEVDGIQATRHTQRALSRHRHRRAHHLRRRQLRPRRTQSRRPQLPDQRRRPGRHSQHAAKLGRGLSVLDPTIQAKLVGAATRTQPPDTTLSALPTLPDGLTRREAEILTMMAQGMANPEIAATLYLSPHTVKSHINRIFTKTGSPDRATALRYARDHGLV